MSLTEEGNVSVWECIFGKNFLTIDETNRLQL